MVIYIGLWRNFFATIWHFFVTRDPRLAKIHDDLSENMRFKSCTANEWIEACREATSNIPLLWTLCAVNEMSTIYSGHCSASCGSILRGILKVQLLKSDFSNKSMWISANLKFLVTNLMSDCSWEMSPNPYINNNTIEQFISKLLLP